MCFARSRLQARITRTGHRFLGSSVLEPRIIFLLGGRLLSSFLFGVSPHDPVVLLLAPLDLAVTAFMVCLLPAMRAARTEPIEVLGSE